MNNISSKHIIIALLAAAVMILSSLFVCTSLSGGNLKMAAASLAGASSTEKEFKLTQEQLANLVKPSVVRVVQWVKVKTEIPAFKVNVLNKTVTFPSGYKSLPVDLDVPMAGSGFIVNPEGYILTNAHVVSDESVKMYILAELINKIMLADAETLTKEQVSALAQDIDGWRALGTKVYNEVSAKVNFKIDKKLFIIDPSSKQEDLTKLINGGFPAEIVKTNENFLSDNRDIALIKIDQKNLPAVVLSGGLPDTGSKIYVFGFPSTAEFSRKNFIEPTFSQGVVSSLKDSLKKEFKVIQTDAKVSRGSSGGPMLNEQGDVIGIITYQTSSQDQEKGDSFAFAIPAVVAQDILVGASVKNTSGNFEKHFKAGLALADNKRCKKAIAEFNLAKSINEHFSVTDFIDPYIADCDRLIARGESIDDKWGELKEWARGIGYIAWAIAGAGMLILLALGVMIVVLAKKMKKKDKEVSHLEDLMMEEAAKDSVQRDELEKFIGRGQNSVYTAPAADSITNSSAKSAAALDFDAAAKARNAASQPGEPISAPGTLPASDRKDNVPAQKPLPAADPRLVAYIKEARQSGFSDNAIIEQLKKVGWSDDALQAALLASVDAGIKDFRRPGY